MDSLRKNNIGVNKPIGNVVDSGFAKNDFSKNYLPYRDSPHENLPKYPNQTFRKNDYDYYDKTKNQEEIKDRSTKKIRSVFSITLFLMIIVFAAVIGWYEFKDNDNSLEKLLSKNAPADKSDSLEAKTSANSSNAAASAKAAQAQAAQSAQQDQAASTNTESTNTGITSPQEASESEDKKEFKNAEVSFNYPAEYKIEEGNEQIVATKTDTMWRIKIYDNKDKKEIKEWVDSYFSGKDVSDCSESDSTTLKIGILATKIMKDGDASGKCEGAGYYALNSDKTKVARVRLDKADETEANKILSSFKFSK